MYPRTEYEMTQADMDAILDACKPTPVMMIGGSMGSSPQDNANRAWAALGEKMGFDGMTVQPGKSKFHFTAVPSETEEIRAERIKRESTEKRLQKIAKHEAAILEHQAAIAAAKESP